jgi:hypothetical protein
MHKVNFRVSFWRARGRVNVVTAKVAADVESVFDGYVGEVLVAEDYDLLLGDEESKFIFLRKAQTT